MRKYTIHRAPGTFLTFGDRTLLEKEWNRRVEHGPRTTMRSFAREMGLPFETWRREYRHGRTCEPRRDPDRPGRWIYGTYDAGKAQDEINRNAANKGCPMLVTNVLSDRFTHLVKECRLSPYDAVCRMKEDDSLKGKWIPAVSTWYKHIRHGDIPVHYGDTPYHPDRERRKGPKPHMAKPFPAGCSSPTGPRRRMKDPGQAIGRWTPSCPASTEPADFSC